MRTAFVCVVALVAFGAAPAQAQSVLYRPPNLSGTWVPDAGVVQFNFVHRFHVFPSPNHAVVNYPTFTLAAGLTSQLALGMRYATHSDVPASANETELYGKWRRQLDGPFAVSLTPAYNMAAKSVDGEASVDWTSGSLTLLGAVRGMSKAYGVDTARMALAGGAVIRLNPYVGIGGDVASLLSTRPGEKPAWSLGLVFAIPNSPHTFSLHASNVDVNTIEGSSRRGPGAASKPIYGFEFTIPLHLKRFAVWFHSRPEPSPTAGIPAAAEVRISSYRFPRDTVTIRAGQ